MTNNLMTNIFVIFIALTLQITKCSQIELPEIRSYYDVQSDDIFVIEDCEDALEKFALSASNYTLCTLSNAHPIHMCQHCVESYINLSDDFNNILTLKVNGTSCKDKLLNLDRLQIVESTFLNMKNLWDRGYCNKCFEWNNNTATLSNDTIKFVEYFNNTKTCINTHTLKHNTTDEICKACMDDYIELNSFYESLHGYSQTTGICMDIVDSMNATRSIWSDVLNCCKLRKTPEIILLTCTAFMAVLPVLFYFATRIFSPEAPEIQVIGRHNFEETQENIPGPSSTLLDNDESSLINNMAIN